MQASLIPHDYHEADCCCECYATAPTKLRGNPEPITRIWIRAGWFHGLHHSRSLHCPACALKELYRLSLEKRWETRAAWRKAKGTANQRERDLVPRVATYATNMLADGCPIYQDTLAELAKPLPPVIQPRTEESEIRENDLADMGQGHLFDAGVDLTPEAVAKRKPVQHSLF